MDHKRHALWSAELVRTGEHLVVVVTGELDLSAHPAFGDRLLELTAGVADPVVDLSGVRLLAAAGVRQLYVVADALAQTGRRLRVVTGTGLVLRVLRAAQATDVLETYVTLAAAGGAARPGPAGPSGLPELEQLRLEVTALRAKLASRPAIARALGVIEERYRLNDMEEAFRLLRSASQVHNIKLVVLAKTLVTLPRPHSRAWLIAALQRPAPRLSFAATDRPGTTPATILERLVRRALAVTGATAGYAQLPNETGLRLAAHHGLDKLFTGVFARIDGEQSTCTAALATGVAVTSTNIALDPLFSRPDTRRALLGAGFTTARSVPLASPAVDCVGVLTVLSRQAFPAQVPEELDCLCREAGAWLQWHRHHQVLTALQHLHAQATTATPG
ncbi:ANTAR domain-containing protein [Amycolatopsis vancoresmycina]|uniref:ANTAR domain-containing protein n=1 Tax=Amycolatopsis vancoresmycina DSM 44592 TaxID=1292037 RepID=R1G0P7_9PSEU|nr:ANTAR domain-containing protein [Amycolatopsis vancoresmycina]EOD65148.1 ANTAR domain-containing protein [Amycolatopsis vancoresmycina DSM 44592]